MKTEQEIERLKDDYTIGFAIYLMQKRRNEVDRMQAEIKRLKDELLEELKK